MPNPAIFDTSTASFVKSLADEPDPVFQQRGVLNTPGITAAKIASGDINRFSIDFKDLVQSSLVTNPYDSYSVPYTYGTATAYWRTPRPPSPEEQLEEIKQYILSLGEGECITIERDGPGFRFERHDDPDGEFALAN